ncbi:HD domain-containing phosphohydrolase [Candidatus Omnitrophota bacterium]
MVNILVVDDDRLMRQILFDMLKGSKYNISFSKDATEALNEVKSKPFDVVLTDLIMPGMDGFELIRRIKDIFPDMVILVMTADASLDMAREAIKAGAFDFIMKPFNLNEITVSIKNAIERLRLSKENIQLQETVSLFKISESISTSWNLNQLLEKILNSALEETKAMRGSLMLLDQDKQELRIIASIGLDKERAEKTRIKVGEGISGKVFQEGKPTLITSIDEHPVFSKMAHGYPDKSFISMPMELDERMLVFPLRRKQKVIGVININKKTSGEAFTERDLQIISVLASQAAISIENANLLDTLENNYLNTIQSLALLLEAKDKYTQGHSQRVTLYSMQIARELNLSKEDIKVIKYGAGLHDIGKIGIPEGIINKAGKLDFQELEQMKKHPVIGDDVLKPIKFLEKSRLLVRHHHERLDGKGYPDGLIGKELSILERIIIVADAYEAMSVDRPYRKALKSTQVVEELRKNSGTQFDADVVGAFVKLIT